MLRLGWRADPEDPRDRMAKPRATGVPRAVESRLDEHVLLVRDQQGNDCVGNSGCAVVEIRRSLDGLPPVVLSEHGLYWTARAYDGYQHEDEGAHIRSAARVGSKVGIPSAQAWPSRLATINDRPDIAAEIDGLVRADMVYERIVADPELVLDALQARCPVWFGTQVTSAFARGSLDTIPAPKPTDLFLGGHALAAVGFDRSGERVRILNSWGTGWGSEGKAWLAIEWFTVPTTRDIWVLRPSLEFNDV